MDFRTAIKPLDCQGLVSHDMKLLLVGSCFTDNIGEMLRCGLFDVCVNPFGPVYNPLSIQRAFDVLIDSPQITDDDLFEHEGLWRSFLFHSRYCRPAQIEACEMMNAQIRRGAEYLRRAKVIIITLGTTKVFCETASGNPVANCHKLPARQFDQRMLGLEECTDAIAETVRKIRTVNPDVHIIFTVSPLRYTELGVHGNQLSKSVLLLAVNNVIESSDTRLNSYFPSYEIMMDDLRDYRFYADDMKHPSTQAINYIYNIFSDSYFTDETKSIAADAAALTRRLAHRITTTNEKLADDEAQMRRRAIENLLQRHPQLSNAIEHYKRYIIQQ